MIKYAKVFAVIVLLLTLVVAFALTSDKLIQFVIMNSIILCGLGIFFTIFHKKLKIYVQNYHREKRI